jgi:signal transduction histidine kinase
MSLRVLLWLVVLLSLIAMAVAAFAVASVLADSDASAARSAEASGATAARALAGVYPGLAAPVSEEAARAEARRVLAPVEDTRGGFCWADGRVVEEESATMRGPHGPPPGQRSGPEPRQPPPEIRALILRTCEAARPGAVHHVHAARARDTIVVSAIRIDHGAAAFTTRVVPRRPGPRGLPAWWSTLGAMALVTLAMVAVTLATMAQLRGGVGDVGRVLVRLEEDLRAEPPPPRTREFAEIADRLRAMAIRLADTRERERELERRVAHEARLSALGRMVAGVAHEVRNPLTGIKLLLDGMRRRAGDDRSREELETCLAEIRRLDHVVTSFLGAARDARSAAETIDLAALAAERAAHAAALAAVRGISVETRGGGELVAERDVVVRVVDNLVRNAIEASPPGAAVEIRVDTDAAGARVRVVDRGAGVPAEVAGSLFEPFVSSKTDGTGLGLWLSRALVASRGGDLRYDRQGGETHFILSLPRVPPDEPPHDPGRR